MPPLPFLWRRPVSASLPHLPGGAHAQRSGRDDAVPGPAEREDCFSPFFTHRLFNTEFKLEFLAYYKFDFQNTDTIVFLSSRPFQ